MDKRYFIDRHGAQTTRMLGMPGAGHIDVAKEVLAAHGATLGKNEELCVRMFRLRYVRVVEFDDGSVEVEHGPKPTTAQKRLVDELSGKATKFTLKRTRSTTPPIDD